MENKTPQLEDGYIRIANEIVDKLISYRISGEEWQILLVVLRKTYGFHKKEDHISLSQFQKYTGLKRPNVIRGIKKLVAKKILGSIKKDTSISNLYWFNKQFKNWQPSIKKDTTPSASINKDNELVAKKIHTKDIYTKDIILSKDSIGEKPPPPPDKRNKEVELILTSYKNNMGFSPTDRKPRFTAQNLRQNILTFLKQIQPKRPDFTFENVLEKTWEWYMEREDLKGNTLDAFRRKAKMLFELTLKKEEVIIK